ncbi:pirin family protein [Litorimonas sp.]|uniref:pirin family protein n=1 Tax=Litorimonas sp. TaxID=1892381 RepID=UPI003A842CAA
MTPQLSTDVTQENAPAMAGGLHLRPAEERGKADHGWLKTAYSFSFSQYYDPAHMGFGPLRVINDDYIDGGKGFPTHPHDNMEIFSYILDGALAHKDSMGNGSTVKAGGVQYMSAGTGVRHSEYNPSETKQVHLLQIWLLPNVKNETPRYETKDLTPEEKDGKLALFLSHDGRGDSMRIKSNADIYAATLEGHQSIETVLEDGHGAWIQVARGALSVNGQKLKTGDGLAIEKGGHLEFTNGDKAEIIYFDMWG